MSGFGARAQAGSVLVAEDNESNYELIRDLVESCGWRVTWAKEGAETVAAIRRQNFDLLLLDLHMPGVDGVEALRRLHADPPEELPRIVVITADIFYGVRADLEALGVDSMLAKPIDLVGLAHVLETTPVAAGAPAEGP
jgi:two-component system, sensor histidine kinase